MVDADRPFFGFSEISHTADIAIDVFAPDLAELFVQAAKGLYHILGIRKGTGEPKLLHISMEAEDDESLLVSFLNELLYFAENGKAAEDIHLIITQHRLDANMLTVPILTRQKEIKAATFNNLKIIKEKQIFQTHIVFDI